MFKKLTTNNMTFSVVTLTIFMVCDFTKAEETRFSADVFGYTHNKNFKSRYGYRIPSALVTKNDTALAFIERRKGLGDHAKNDMVVRRSEDGGKTWGKTIVINDNGNHCLCNPCAVMIPKSGRILIMYQDYPADRHSVDIPHQKVKRVDPGFTGDKIVKTFIQMSDDDGKTWSAPRDVTSGNKREHTIANGTGPGIGIVLSSGQHSGRIIMPQNDSWYDKNNTRHYDLFASFSDDGGKTWKIGNAAPYDKKHQGEGGEVQMVEIENGHLLLNSRSYHGKGYRKISVSKDGGVTWSPVVDDLQLPEPVCMGSILRVKIPGKENQHCLLFSCPANKHRRKEGTIYLSYDNGKTWSDRWVLEPNDFAYSCLVQFSDGSIGCFYEGQRYKRMIFTRFSFESLLQKAIQ